MTTASIFSNWLIAAPMLLTLGIVLYGIRAFGWLKTLKVTNALLEEQNTALRCGNTDLKAHVDTITAQAAADNIKRDLRICSLEGQVDLLKTVPLQEISITMKEILLQLRESENTLAENTASALAARDLVKDVLAHHEAK